ncbi:uncharacterized protein [Halyomorpha halys]|uniref:uncharacterized protein n=1 Tax=Halyomorpha halys TaxID=286706 RepID=UPI0006D4CE9E|nr:uncharacterized protein LOC106678727 [Halyomorpha halys]XP_014272932.1 uncharacterized protein LOC106678727 [Halyomorpha halys]XP_014272933.1 uncharacterized protein LOC106678727 [Halyomorpha halys]XP_014272934.1 uncharacterized protein LOC106678727 [Halyomorpha halys]
MDEEERLMTRMIRVLLDNALITFGGAASGGILLGPAGLAIGAAAASSLHLVASEGITTWDRLRAARGWKDLVFLALQVAAQLAIRNSALLYDLAIKLARLLENLFNSHHNHNPPISH